MAEPTQLPGSERGLLHECAKVRARAGFVRSASGQLISYWLRRDDGTGVTAPAHSGSQNAPNSSRPRHAAGCVDDVSSNESQTCETRMREAGSMGGSISGCGTQRHEQENSTRRNCRQQATSLRKPHRSGSRLYASMSLTALLSACCVCLLPGRASAADVLFFVSVYEWTLVWKDFRNPNYNMGSIWRPKMMSLLNEADPVHFNRSDFPGERNREIDGYDVREYVSENFGVVYFGDVFMIGHGTSILDLYSRLSRAASASQLNSLNNKPGRTAQLRGNGDHGRSRRHRVPRRAPLLCKGQDCSQIQGLAVRYP